MPSRSPLTLTISPRLTTALNGDGPAFERAMSASGPEETESWFRSRVGDDIENDLLGELVNSWFAAEGDDERVLARAELAELLGDVDDAASELLWEASMQHGFARGDGEQAFDAIVHLAELAEQTGDPLTAAEFYIDFLNWRRDDAHVAAPESVHRAFEEIVRLADEAGEASAAARFSHHHADFVRVAEDNGEAAVEGDWTSSGAPFVGWE